MCFGSVNFSYRSLAVKVKRNNNNYTSREGEVESFIYVRLAVRGEENDTKKTTSLYIRITFYFILATYANIFVSFFKFIILFQCHVFLRTHYIHIRKCRLCRT